jgi:hypothetical protein
MVSPLKPNCTDFFIYTDDGQILATDASEKNAAATKTIKQLRLNIPKLKAMREEVIKNLLVGLDVFTLTEEEKQKLLQGLNSLMLMGSTKNFVVRSPISSISTSSPKQRVSTQIASLDLNAIASINPQISKAKLE